MSNPEEQYAVGKVLCGIEHPVIVELGAHVGEDSQWILPLCKGTPRYIMVEPDLDNCFKIRQHYAGILIHAAVGGFDGDGWFYPAHNPLAHNRASGSIRRPTGHLMHFPEVVFEQRVPMPFLTLDTIAKDQKLDRIDLLWVDIQGAERDMIAGGQKTLAHTCYMMIEAEPEVELYEGQALKPELIALLPGWEVMEDFGYNLLMRNTQCI